MKKSIFMTLFVLIAMVSVTIIGQVVQAKSSSSQCLDPKNPRSFSASMQTRNSGTITTINGQQLCGDATMVMQSFNVPDTWDKKGWNKTAIPQTSFAKKEFTFPGKKSNHKMTVTVDAPDECRHTQTDFYTEKGYDKIETLAGDDARNVIGVLFKGTGKCKEPKPEEPKKIKVCRLNDKKYPVEINKKDFDKTKYSKNEADCKEEPTPKPEEPKTPQTPQTPKETPAELPQTGIGAIGGLIGSGSLVAAGYQYIRSRKNL